MTNLTKKITFSIEHIDSLGQGVSKLNDTITFIPKTLPGEKGSAIIYKKSKGVNFATTNADLISEKSLQRITPACEHFDYCQGCHYLHCSHEDELSFKEKDLRRLFQKIAPDATFEVISLHERFYYRNRIQLHYDLKKRQLGFINKYTNQIHSVKSCLLPEKVLGQFLSQWYQTNEWMALAKNEKPRGHVELILIDDKVQIHWNKRYSSGGFTQVNQAMNKRMLEIIYSLGVSANPKTILDLFAGNGNLTNHIKKTTQSKRIAVDLYPHGEVSEEFITLNLDDENSLSSFTSKCDLNNVDLLVADPPRKGFKFLKQWCDKYIPNEIIYVSCNPATLVRDISLLNNYQVEKILLLDMFASTYHYETLVVLKKS